VLRKIGLVPVVVKSGAYKDMGSPVREMTEQERKILQNLVDKIHSQFIRDVAAGRNMEKEVLSGLADGRIYTGEEAKDLGLVDRIGNIEDSIEWAGRKGGIEGKIDVVYAPEKRFSLMKYVLGTLFGRLSELMLSTHIPLTLAE
jgi:protease-4